MIFYATLPPGLEEVSAKEIEGFGGKVTEIRRNRGRVFFEGDLELMAKLNYMARTIERVMILLEVERFESLDDIYRIVRNLDLDWIKPDQSFAIRPLRVGEHDFTSLDVGRVVGQAVIDSYMEARGVRLRVNLDEPDVIIRVDVIFDEVYVGIDTTGDEALHRRGYRVYNHPAPLNPTIASAMVMLSKWRPEEILVDPMCGSATIPIEAGMIGKNLPPQAKRRDFQFVRIFGYDLLRKVIESMNFIDREMTLVGVERFRRHLLGAKLNCREAGVDVHLIQGDATEPCLKEADVIITNPPYGLRIARKGLVERLYEGFLKSAREMTERLAVITAEDRIFREKALKLDYVIEREIWVKYGGLDTRIFLLHT